MMEHHYPQPIQKRFFTPGVLFLCLLVANGLVFAVMRFVFGIGSITHLNQQYPWGIWIGIDVAAGVALAAGGFTTAALVYVFHQERFHDLVRPALLTAMLGYTFVALGVLFDLGRYYFIYHPLFMWNGNSVLFEVGICVMAYISVLYIEFMPIVCERFLGRVSLPGKLALLRQPVENLLKWIQEVLKKTLFFFIILGIVLSCLHQSSLGTLMIIAGQKIHPLWQTPIAPLLFLLSAFAVGFPMVIMEGLVGAKSFDLKPEMPLLSPLAKWVGPMLLLVLAFRLGDMAIRETWVYLNAFNKHSVMWAIEIIFGLLIPLRLFFWKRVRQSPRLLLVASLLVIFGVFLNRFNTFVTAYHPPYAKEPYWPSYGEISVTLGFIALEILLYRLMVKLFPVITQAAPQRAKRFAREGRLL
jgi:Ni/Fe-hydrogenase subunit HybB-like protein